ncbi:MAG: TolC family protein, partial [Legionellales bacterium]|nr:TolC family protein [Legionellales bacterium]
RLTVDDLGRWIGRRAAAQIRVNSLENIVLPPRHKLSRYIHQHPLLRRDSALIDSSKSMFRWAEQQKIPAFAIGINYGYRQGRNMDGSRRSQFVSASVTFDLPLFSSNRQDKVISANENKIQAAESARQTEYRNMLKMFYEERHIIEHSSQRIHLLQTQIVPRAQEFAESSLTAYQNNQVDFLSISKAYQAQLKDKLDLLKARVKRAQAFVMLEYLRGK